MKLILLILIGFNLLYAELTRTNEVVYDSNTTLYWQDNNESSIVTKEWQGAIDYCEALTLDGQSDWRLPNKKELLSIVDYSVYNPSISSVFQNITSNYYWSSTTYAYYTSSAWRVHFYGGGTYSYRKTYSNYVRCVRGGQSETLIIKKINLLSETNVDYSIEKSVFTKSWEFSEDISAFDVGVVSNTYSNSVTGTGFTKNANSLSVELTPNSSSAINKLELKFSVNGNPVKVNGSDTFWSLTKTNYAPRLADAQTTQMVGAFNESTTLDIATYDGDGDRVTLSVVDSDGGSVSFSGTTLSASFSDTQAVHTIQIALRDGKESVTKEINVLRFDSTSINSFYSDVDPNDSAHNFPDIAFATLAGVVAGQSDPNDVTKRIFRPRDDVSMAEALAMIINGAKKAGLIEVVTEPYYREAYPSWVMPYYSYAKDVGAVGELGGDLSIIYPTRQEIAQIVVKVLGLDEKLSEFPDIDVSFNDEADFSNDAMIRYAEVAKVFGLFMTGDWSFAQMKIERADMAILIKKMFMMPRADVVVSPANINYGDTVTMSLTNVKAGKVSTVSYKLEDSSSALQSQYVFNKKTVDGDSYDSVYLHTQKTNQLLTFLDNNGVRNIISREVNVTYVNRAPFINIDTNITLDEDNSSTFVYYINDEDFNLSLVLESYAVHGSVSISGTDVTYTPDSNYFGADTFTLSTTDSSGLKSSKNVSVNVVSVNDEPVISGTSPVVVNKNANYSFTPVASDGDGDTLTFSITNRPSWASFDTTTGTLSGIPAYSDVGITSNILISVTDLVTSKSLASFDLEVLNVNNVPVAVNDTGFVNEDGVLDPIVVLTNDSDSDTEDIISVTGFTQTSSGVLVDNGDNTFKYTPNTNFSGYDSFTYTISDGHGVSSTASVSITINSINDTPVLEISSSVDCVENESVNLVYSSSDIEDGVLTPVVETQAFYGVVNVGTGITYTPSADFVGNDEFVISIIDSNGIKVTKTVFVRVKRAFNTPPVITSEAIVSVDEKSVYNYKLEAVDIDGDELSWSVKDGTILPSWLSLSSGDEVKVIAGRDVRYIDENAIEVPFAFPSSIAFDSSGNMFVTDSENNVIRKITPSGVASIFAGSGMPEFMDGLGVEASFNFPLGIAVDSSDNLYVSDSGNNAVRKITPAGVVSTFGISEVPFAFPIGITIDSSDNIFVADMYNNAVRKITPDGVVSTVAYNESVNGITVDGDGVLYITEIYGNTIKKIMPDGTITTIAGSGNADFVDGVGVEASFNFPSGIAVADDGSLYVADMNNGAVRKITPDGVVSTISQNMDIPFYSPHDITVGENGSIYVADAGSNIIFEVLSGGVLSGKPLSSDIGVHDVNLTLSDGNNTVEYNFQITVNNVNDAPTITMLNKVYLNQNGRGSVGYSVSDEDGDSFGDLILESNATNGVVDINEYEIIYTADSDFYGEDSFSVSVTDSNGAKSVQEVKVYVNFIPIMTSTELSPIDVGELFSYELKVSDLDDFDFSLRLEYAPDWLSLEYMQSDGAIYAGNINGEAGYSDGSLDESYFNFPSRIISDDEGNVYVADTGNHVIRKIDIDGNVTTIAGSGDAGFSDGSSTESSFYFPNDVALDNDGNIYVADTGNNAIRKIDLNGNVTTVATVGNALISITVDDEKNIYAADSIDNIIRKIDINGTITTFAGNGSLGYDDGNRLSASFASPVSIRNDKKGNLFVSDRDNRSIRKIDVNGNVSTFYEGLMDSYGLSVDKNGDVYVTDYYRIIKIDASGEEVYNFNGYINDNSLYVGRLSGVAVDGFGNVYISDQSNNAIRKITTTTYKLVGTPTSSDIGDNYLFITLDDGRSGSSYDLSIYVNISNTEPVVTIDSALTTDEDNSVYLTFSVDDLDGDTVSTSVSENPTYGTVSISGTNITYIPTLNYFGEDSFTVEFSDGNGGVVEKTVNVTVSSVNDEPSIIIDSTLTVVEDGTTTFSFTYADLDEDIVSASVTSFAQNGEVDINTTEITYTPETGYSGDDSFTITLTDSNGYSVDKVISVTVIAKEIGSEVVVEDIDEPTQEVVAEIPVEVVNDNNTTTVSTSFATTTDENITVEVIVAETVVLTTNSDNSTTYQGVETQNDDGSLVEPLSVVSANGTINNTQTLTINGEVVQALLYIEAVGANIEILDDGSMVSSIEMLSETNATVIPKVVQSSDGKTLNELSITKDGVESVVNVVSDIIGTDSVIAKDGTLTTTAELINDFLTIKPETVVSPDGTSLNRVTIVDENNESIEVKISSKIVDSNISMDVNGSLELTTSVTSNTNITTKIRAKLNSDGSILNESTFIDGSGNESVASVEASIAGTDSKIGENGAIITTTPTITSTTNTQASVSVEVTKNGEVKPILFVVKDGVQSTFNLSILPAGSVESPLNIKVSKRDNGSMDIEIETLVPTTNIKREE